MNIEMLVALISFASLVVAWAVVPSRGEEHESIEVTAPVAKQATA
jgi:hypothetical protein